MCHTSYSTQRPPPTDCPIDLQTTDQHSLVYTTVINTGHMTPWPTVLDSSASNVYGTPSAEFHWTSKRWQTHLDIFDLSYLVSDIFVDYWHWLFWLVNFRSNVLFLSLVSILTRDTDIANLSVCPSVRPSVRYVPVSDENGLTYRHSFFTIR